MRISDLDKARRLSNEVESLKRYRAEIQSKMVVMIAIGNHTATPLEQSTAWGRHGIMEDINEMTEDLRTRLKTTMLEWCDARIDANNKELQALGVELEDAA